MTNRELVQASNVSVHFPLGGAGDGKTVHAVDDVSISVARGETLGIVGESGSGKSTLGRALLRMVSLKGGTIKFDGVDIASVNGRELRELRSRMQMVFQDPAGSLDPRLTVLQSVAEPMVAQGLVRRPSQARDRVVELLTQVGLPSGSLERYPRSFSGGQCQRIGIARALVLKPDLIVADEPVSSLDVSVQAQVVNTMLDLQRNLGMAYVFISHDIAVVRQVSHRIAVLYAGKVVEIGPQDEIVKNPSHPYTRALISAVPLPDPAREKRRERIVLKGDPVDPVDPGPGCRFATRCPLVQEVCLTEHPPLTVRGPNHSAACWVA